MNLLPILSKNSKISYNSLCNLFANCGSDQKFSIKTLPFLEGIHQDDLVVLEISHRADLANLSYIMARSSNIIVIISNPGMMRKVLKEELPAVLISPASKEECRLAIGKVIKRMPTKKSQFKKTKPVHVEKLKVEYINTDLVVKQNVKPPSINKENPLTGRQIEVLQSVSNGFLYKEIAGQFGISVGTVKQHLHNIYDKLQVNNKVEAINFYRESQAVASS